MAGSLTGGSERFAAGLPILSILTIPPGPATIPLHPQKLSNGGGETLVLEAGIGHNEEGQLWGIGQVSFEIVERV